MPELKIAHPMFQVRGLGAFDDPSAAFNRNDVANRSMFQRQCHMPLAPNRLWMPAQRLPILRLMHDVVGTCQDVDALAGSRLPAAAESAIDLHQRRQLARLRLREAEFGVE